MIRLALLLISLVAAASGAAAVEYGKRLFHVLEQLRACEFESPQGTLPMVGGRAVGYAGTPHEFYLLFPYVSRLATDNDVLNMLTDRNAVVRIMGATCILKGRPNLPASKIDVLLTDTTRVCVAPYGSQVSIQTVAELIGELKRNPNLFGDAQRANKAPEPTPGAVTPRATEGASK